jgi:carbon monoxide dehydrogenase subunit G
MPEVVATVAVDRPLSGVWAFVRDMNQWAPFVKGYVGHEQSSDTDSVWTLTGDLGPFSKTIELKVRITEWVEMERVAFEMEGVTELVTATGALDLAQEAPFRTQWQRFWDWLLRREVSPGTSHVTFTFGISAGGPMGPMINPMLGPYADAVARELLASVAAHLEGDHD